MKFSNILQRATSATSNKQILQRVTNDFTSNEQRVILAGSDFLKQVISVNLS